MEDILIYFSIKYQGDWDMIYEAISKKEAVNKEDVDKLLLNLKNNCLTLLDKNYPEGLKNTIKPPFVLFYKGDLNLLNDKRLRIAVIGSRESSDYGKKMCEKIVSDMAKEKVIIVSGFAKGIDTIAHNSSLENKLPTIAVFGGGIDECYPPQNSELYNKIIENNGLLISEYPDNVMADKEHFPLRNRIIAGLSNGVVVVEAKNKSGTMITVKYALETGKDIFCVPQLATVDSGCNTLIKNGAKLVINGDDILEEYYYLGNNKVSKSVD